jgi:hypothetical protein
MPTSVKNANSDYSQLTNKSIVYHFSSKSKNPGQYAPGALIFAFRSPRKFGLECHDKSKRVADLFELNEWFKEMAIMPEHRVKNALYLDTAEKVLQEVRFAGVLKGALTASSRERHLGTCIMNNVVGERASVVNVWGHDAKEGAGMYMIITKDKKSKPAWRVIPHAGKSPTACELKFIEDGQIKFGRAFFIGTAISTPTPCAEGNERLIDDPVRSRRLAGYAGGVDVCIGV